MRDRLRGGLPVGHRQTRLRSPRRYRPSLEAVPRVLPPGPADGATTYRPVCGPPAALSIPGGKARGGPVPHSSSPNGDVSPVAPPDDRDPEEHRRRRALAPCSIQPFVTLISDPCALLTAVHRRRSSCYNSGQPYPKCRRADADGQGLTILVTRSDTTVELQIAGDTINGGERLLALDQKQKGMQREVHAAANDEVGIGDAKHRPPGSRVRARGFHPSHVDAPGEPVDDLPGVQSPRRYEGRTHTWQYGLSKGCSTTVSRCPRPGPFGGRAIV